MSLLSGLFADPDEPNARLEELMRALAAGDTEPRRAAFYRELLASSLWLATPGAVASERVKAGAGAAGGEGLEISFVSTRDEKGRSRMLVFTGKKALLAWRPVGCDTMAVRTPELCRLALTAGMDSVAINVAGPVGGLVTAPELRVLAEGHVPEMGGLKEKVPGRVEFRAPAARRGRLRGGRAAGRRVAAGARARARARRGTRPGGAGVPQRQPGPLRSFHGARRARRGRRQ